MLFFCFVKLQGEMHFAGEKREKRAKMQEMNLKNSLFPKIRLKYVYKIVKMHNSFLQNSLYNRKGCFRCTPVHIKTAKR